MDRLFNPVRSSATALMASLAPPVSCETATPTINIPTIVANPRFDVGQSLQATLSAGTRITRQILRPLMEDVYAGSDASGVWDWAEAYACAEVAELIYCQNNFAQTGKTLSGKTLDALDALSAQQPPVGIRSETVNLLQQFSTPLPIAIAAVIAAQISRGDSVLEPSAGHGHLVALTGLTGSSLILNELDKDRRRVLAHLFKVPVSNHDAAQIDTRLDASLRPSVVLMNPPFAVNSKTGGKGKEAERHVASAFNRLVHGGRLVAIVGGNFDLKNPYLKIMNANGTVVADLTIAKGAFKSRGTNVETRLVVIDKINQRRIHAVTATVTSTGQLAHKVKLICGRGSVETSGSLTLGKRRCAKSVKPRKIRIARTNFSGEPVQYTVIKDAKPEIDPNAIYVPYSVRALDIQFAQPHVAILTQSAALASVVPPRADYVPHLPFGAVRNGLLSDAQIETITYAGQAHSRLLNGSFKRNPQNRQIALCTPDDPEGFQLRQGYFLGDGTGCGKGRQLAGIIMDNFIKGRRRAVWISKNDSLLQDAVRDWTDIGGSKSDILHQAKTPYGVSIPGTEGILFTTFSTLRGDASDDRVNRLDQLLEWLGDGFEGVIAFDEAHSMANAMNVETDMGVKAASQQALAGLDLQFMAPDARIVYSSATGASEVENLAYADRLGLWRGQDAPFTSQSEFISEMYKGGVAAMEMICRDLKALGLYCARNLSFEGVEYEFLDHALTSQQTMIYDNYADAFQYLHHSMEDVLGIIGAKMGGGKGNPRAVGAARSAFEGMKQRFFCHLLTAMKVPSLVAAIEQDIENGCCAVIQVVSTGEAVMERQIVELSAEEIASGDFNLTPREAIMDFLQGSFPTTEFEEYIDENQNVRSRPAVDTNGDVLRNRQAERIREQLMQRIGSLPPVTSAMDQIIWHFGPKRVAEITGRSRRIIRDNSGLTEVVKIEKRGPATKTSETDAFMDGEKDVLVFSDAGGTGRSYHSDRTRLNQKRRVHYLLEPGWRADAAIQGLGRTHRTNQANAPLFRPVSTDVKGEKRFLSTIARRLDTLGALTKGERQTGGQGMFKAEDNLESAQAEQALRVFFKRIAHTPQNGIGLTEFTKLTGLSICDENGNLNENLPPIRRFLNRMLALTIENQNTLFDVFTEILANRVEEARAAGILDEGAETIKADTIRIISETDIRADENTGARTQLVHVETSRELTPLTFESAKDAKIDPTAAFHRNTKSGRVALVMDASSVTDINTGMVYPRVKIYRPGKSENMRVDQFMESAWETVSTREAKQLWEDDIKRLPTHQSERFALVTGLILPLWSLLSSNKPTVYRLTSDAGRTYLGRMVELPTAEALEAHFGLNGSGEVLSAEEVLGQVRKGVKVKLTETCDFKRSKVMEEQRIEIKGFETQWLDTLKSFGCFVEIIRWETRCFIPDGPNTVSIIEKTRQRFAQLTSDQPVGCAKNSG